MASMQLVHIATATPKNISLLNNFVNGESKEVRISNEAFVRNYTFPIHYIVLAGKRELSQALTKGHDSRESTSNYCLFPLFPFPFSPHCFSSWKEIFVQNERYLPKPRFFPSVSLRLTRRQIKFP